MCCRSGQIIHVHRPSRPSMQSTEQKTLAPSAPRILLVTFDWSTLQEMPYLLKQAGCEVDVLCPSSNLAIKNGFFDRWIDSGDSMNSLIESLLKLADDRTYARWFGRDFSGPFKSFLAANEHEVTPYCDQSTDAVIEEWEVTHFASHFAKLLNAGRHLDAIQHLLDFDRNLRYTLYDPVLLRSKMNDLHQQILAQRKSAQPPSPATVAANPPPERTMRTFKIDDKEYDLDSLSAEAKAQLQSIQFVDQELARLQA